LVELPGPDQCADYRLFSKDPDKMTALIQEYTLLLTSQLESQREFFEMQLANYQEVCPNNWQQRSLIG